MTQTPLLACTMAWLQAKLKAEKYRKKIEDELAQLEAEKMTARKAEITMHRL